MRLCHRLVQAFDQKAQSTEIEILSVGLGYTAVTTTDGGIGIAYTALGMNKEGCTVLHGLPASEGRPASDLLHLITSDNPLHRSVGLATINALNSEQALSLPEDRDNDLLFSHLGITTGTKVAMVGYFGPLVSKLRDMGAEVEIIDTGRALGDAQSFSFALSSWAQALILTSTSLLNDSTESILKSLAPGVRTVLLGPSTPLVAAPFASLHVHVLAGTVPVSKEETLQAIRHGQGTPVLQRFARKPYMLVND